MSSNVAKPYGRKPRRAAAAVPYGAAVGFTLLEVLVVLLVVALIAASLFEGLARFNDARSRFGLHAPGNSDKDSLLDFWFRETVNSAWSGAEGDAPVFIGNRATFSGLTLMPLDRSPGAPTEFKWDLVYNSLSDRTTLVYTGVDGRPRELRSWAGSRIGFSYLGSDLVWHDDWPIDGQHTGQLPLAVRLFASTQHWTVVAAVKGETTPAPRVNGLSVTR